MIDSKMNKIYEAQDAQKVTKFTGPFYKECDLYTYTIELCSRVKKNETGKFLERQMDLELLY